MINCPFCTETVNFQAKVCPHCTSQLLGTPEWYAELKKKGIMMLVLGGAFVIFCLYIFLTSN